jgi:hypothetical protein
MSISSYKNVLKFCFQAICSVHFITWSPSSSSRIFQFLHFLAARPIARWLYPFPVFCDFALWIRDDSVYFLKWWDREREHHDCRGEDQISWFQTNYILLSLHCRFYDRFSFWSGHSQIRASANFTALSNNSEQHCNMWGLLLCYNLLFTRCDWWVRRSKLQFWASIQHVTLSYKWYVLSSRRLSKNAKIKLAYNFCFHVVLYGCETWSPILRKEHTLRVFQNRAEKNIWTLEGGSNKRMQKIA